jgi:hypothetical protein
VRTGTGGTEAAALLLAVAAGACAGHFPACPAAGGPAWTELQGAHVRLRTDADVAAGRATLEDLEQIQAALLHIFSAATNSDTGRMPVIVVDRGWADFAPYRVSGYFTRALFQPLVVIGAGRDIYRQEIIKHELVHYFSHMVMPRQPLWLSEGLATYYETLEYDADKALITVGRPSLDRLRVAQRNDASDFAEVFAAEVIGEDLDAFYATAWSTVHYLMNHREAALAAYEKALHEGATPREAWKTAFGEHTPASLGAEILRYVDGGQYELRQHPFTAPHQASPAERRLSDAETHATRALLYLTGSNLRVHAPDLSFGVEHPRAEAKAEVAEALRQQPDHVAARAIARFMLGIPIALEQATDISRKHGEDWLAWLLVVASSHGPDDGTLRADALARALDIARRDPSVSIELSIEKK